MNTFFNLNSLSSKHITISFELIEFSCLHFWIHLLPKFEATPCHRHDLFLKCHCLVSLVELWLVSTYFSTDCTFWCSFHNKLESDQQLWIWVQMRIQQFLMMFHPDKVLGRVVFQRLKINIADLKAVRLKESYLKGQVNNLRTSPTSKLFKPLTKNFIQFWASANLFEKFPNFN